MIESVKVDVKWEPGAYDKLTKEVPDRTMFEIAETTLNMSFPIMPERTGRMKQTSLAKGVQGSNCNYRIGSYTDYASYVYVKPDNTNWTTPGSEAHWFMRTWERYGSSITNEAVERNKLK